MRIFVNKGKQQAGTSLPANPGLNQPDMHKPLRSHGPIAGECAIEFVSKSCYPKLDLPTSAAKPASSFAGVATHTALRVFGTHDQQTDLLTFSGAADSSHRIHHP
jgi:hypothetical protein